jgi:type IV secretion system protein TrbJ
MQRLRALSLVSLLCTSVATATVPVIDAGNIVQSTISAIADVESAIQEALAVINQYTQIANEYTQIANQVQQIANQVKNLEQFSGTSISQLLHVSTQISTTLGQATGVGFDLSQATAQFDQLYAQGQALMNTAAIVTKRQQWMQHRRDAAATAMKVQAVSQNLHTMATNLSQLLTNASGATGNLQIQQVQAQQTGLTQAMLMQIQQILAGNGRLDAQRGAEEAAVQDATLKAIEAATAPGVPYTGANGKLMTYRW